MEKEAKDTIAVMAFHLGTSDPFTTTETTTRKSYYSITGVPTTVCDGTIKRVGSQSYSTYRSDFNTREAISSPLKIELTGSYNAGTNNGNINAHITNTTGSTVSGTIQFVLTETDKAYSWQTEDSLFHIVRDMIPDASGEAVSIPGSGTIDKSRSFTVSSSWNEQKCDIVVFVQGSSKEIYQAAKVHIMDVSIDENPVPLVLNPKLSILPNPFSKKTVIWYSLPVQAINDARLTIYDLLGRIIKVWDLGSDNLNFHQVIWNGQDELGKQVASGIYLCVLKCGDRRVVNKIALTR